MDGFDGEVLVLKTIDVEQVGYEGIFMAKINTWYVVLAAEWLSQHAKLGLFFFSEQF